MSIRKVKCVGKAALLDVNCNIAILIHFYFHKFFFNFRISTTRYVNLSEKSWENDKKLIGKLIQREFQPVLNCFILSKLGCMFTF